MRDKFDAAVIRAASVPGAKLRFMARDFALDDTVAVPTLGRRMPDCRAVRPPHAAAGRGDAGSLGHGR